MIWVSTGGGFLEVLAPLVTEQTLRDAESYVELLFTGHISEDLVQSINPLSEVALSIVDDETAFTLEERFARDLALCREIDYAQWRRRAFWRRLQERIFYYFRLWL